MNCHPGDHSPRTRLLAALILSVLAFQGCHEWPDERGTSLETQKILDELDKVEIVSDANAPWQAPYALPPRKTHQTVGGVEEWRLIYFCRYHKADLMKQIVQEQFATRLFDEKGQSTTVPDYAVTTSQDNDQVIVRCRTEQDVDAVLQILEETDIAPIQVHIDCLVSELSASMTVDRETTLLIENLFGEKIRVGGKDDGTGDVLPAFPGASLREPARDKFGLKIGVDRSPNGNEVKALVDILMSRGYLKVLMNPTLDTLNGQTAKIQSKQQVPLQEITVESGGFGETTVLRTQTEYYEVMDSLQITPHVFADGSISLEAQIQIGSYLAPAGVTQTPIVTERVVSSGDNRIRPGESLIIGGIRKVGKRDVIRGVPILKDIPLLNVLFSGRDFEEQATELLFVLTPTISTGGRPIPEMLDEIERRHILPMLRANAEAPSDGQGK